ncbi:MAG TPA: Gfo/Idh/MocA family oxidoreductase [Candidatus Sulfotelmatobacter sp.]|nr:Gfo/Idh/MocA family oxidoreductase [Candidatus Sulfotelmatobacter sp.]
MAHESEVSRRDFVKTTAAVAAFSGITWLTRPERVFGANDRVRVAVCGLHGRGKDHIEGFSHVSNVEIAALCDVDEGVLDKHRGAARGDAKTFVDVRKLLEDKSIDAISIATPNHWHSLMAIWACQAGKDVYVEKPCSHNFWEGRQLVRAAAKYNRIVQHGTQIRSSHAIQEAVKGIRDGGLIGDVYMARGICFKKRDTIGHAAVEPVPSGVNYDLWTGPAPLKQFTRNRFHYNWHWIWDTGNGDLGNQGIHQVDVARWGLGLKFPTRISAIGGHFMFDDDQETPNTLNCAFEFDLPDGKRKMMEFEVRHWTTNSEADIGRGDLVATKKRFFGHRNAIGNIFYGPNGYLAAGDEDADGYEVWDHDGKSRAHGHGGGDHFANFVDCVRSRKKEELNAPIEEGHISCALVHLANASYRLGRSLRFDAATETVIGDDEANNLLRDGGRGYRAPFVVPDEV